MRTTPIRAALHEDLIQLYQDDDRLTLINMRGLGIKMQRINNDLFLISDTEKISILKLVQFIKVVNKKQKS